MLARLCTAAFDRRSQIIDVEVKCLADAQPGLGQEVEQQPVAELVAWDRRQDGQHGAVGRVQKGTAGELVTRR